MPDLIPDLPGCVVRWDDSTLMIIGSNWYNTPDTYFYGLHGRSPGPDMIVIRTGHACQELIVQGQEYVIVAGGGSERSSEILSKSSKQNRWQRGPDLPENHDGRFQMVVSEDKQTLVTIGIAEGNPNMYQMSCLEMEGQAGQLNCQWKLFPTKLKYGRRAAVAFPVPETLVNTLGCQSMVFYHTCENIET